MGPIALLVVLWVLPLLAAAVFLVAVAVRAAVEVARAVPPAGWALTAVTVTAGAVVGARLGRRRAGTPPGRDGPPGEPPLTLRGT